MDKSGDTTQIEPYIQVFDDKHGFINNLSILDLLFYLKRICYMTFF